MLVFALILRLSLLALLLPFKVPCFGVLSLLPLSLVLWLLMKVDHNLSAQLGACARTHAPALARIVLLMKKTRFSPGLFFLVFILVFLCIFLSWHFILAFYPGIFPCYFLDRAYYVQKKPYISGVFGFLFLCLFYCF